MEEELLAQLQSKKQKTDLIATTKTEHQVKSRLLLDVVVGQSAAIFQLLAREDQALLIGRDSFLVLDLGLDGFDVIRGVDIKSDGLARKGLNEDLHRHDELSERWQHKY
jgi:hypothetical protein